MELFRTLGILAEIPGEETRSIASLLDLEPPPEVAEHTDLFLFQLFPFASVYLDGEGKLGGEARDRIAGFWRALDLSPPPEPDHLTLLLAFYSQIQEHLSQSDQADRDRWQHVRTAFLWEHLLSWLPFYLDKVQDVGSEFYRKWAILLEEALKEQAAELPSPTQLPLHLRQAPKMVDPRQETDQPFLEFLLSPVRSGFILVRDDLARAGRDLKLAVRKGERTYALEALLSQDDERTLLWLATEAASWPSRHLAWEPAIGPIATFWADRATATAALLHDLSRDL
jgi:hypothetical protein